MKNTKQNQSTGEVHNLMMKDRKGWKQNRKNTHLKCKECINGETHIICKDLKMYILKKKQKDILQKKDSETPNVLQNSIEENKL